MPRPGKALLTGKSELAEDDPEEGEESGEDEIEEGQ